MTKAQYALRAERAFRLHVKATAAYESLVELEAALDMSESPLSLKVVSNVRHSIGQIKPIMDAFKNIWNNNSALARGEYTVNNPEPANPLPDESKLSQAHEVYSEFDHVVQRLNRLKRKITNSKDYRETEYGRILIRAVDAFLHHEKISECHSHFFEESQF